MNARSVCLIASGVLVTLVTVALARLSFGLILPAMRESLALSYAQAGHLGTATALGYLALVMVAGALAARRGGRVSILLGLVCVIVGFAGLSMASEYVPLLGLMSLLGIGTAFAYTPLISLIGTWFPARRGLVIGLLNSGVGTGMMSAGWIVPYMTQLDADRGWRWVWALFAAVAVAALLATLAFVQNPPRPGLRGRAPSAAERRDARRAVFRDPRVVIVGLVYGIVGLTYIVQAIFMYSYALAADIDAHVAGALAAFMGMLGIVFGPVWGSLSDRLGRGQSLTLSMAMAFVSTLLPVLSPTLFGFAAHYLILGVAVTGMFTSSLAASTEWVDADQAPLAVSYVTLFFATGQLLGPTAAGWLIGDTEAFRLTFGVSTGLILLGVLLSIQLTRMSKASLDRA
ncbi:major facilitator transporter [Salinisphaera sp. C84B14]|uniref:MFS transporter n=1 Tax=Salinisphaera sp. C84B14 TaxID=1304155 RepID=UPI003340B66A